MNPIRASRPSSLLRQISLAIVGAMACATPAMAAYPEQPLTIMVGFGAGGGTDTLARLVASAAEASFGQPIVVKNVPGGGGVVAATKLLNAKPDGYTIGMAVTSTFSYAPVASKSVKFKPDDFVYPASVAKLQNCVVAKGDAPFNSLEELVAAVKAGKHLSFASSSPAVTLTMQYVSRQAGIDMKIVPVKGGAAAMKEVLGGHMDLAWSAGIHQKYLKDRSLKVIVASGARRLPSTPKVPTLRELGYDVGSDTHFLFFAPKGIPKDVLDKLVKTLASAASSAKVKALAQDKMGFPNEVLSPEELHAEVMADTESWKRLIKLAEEAKK
ncbi:MAG: tripartite tricarboxylate transporter substrate binding protein [Burkholderiaceae bacterium]